MVFTMKVKRLRPEVIAQARALIEPCGGKDYTRSKGIPKTVSAVFRTKERAKDFRTKARAL